MRRRRSLPASTARHHSCRRTTPHRRPDPLPVEQHPSTLPFPAYRGLVSATGWLPPVHQGPSLGRPHWHPADPADSAKARAPASINHPPTNVEEQAALASNCAAWVYQWGGVRRLRGNLPSWASRRVHGSESFFIERLLCYKISVPRRAKTDDRFYQSEAKQTCLSIA